MKTGIVIVNYNKGQLVADIARKFSEYENIDSIVIVDNLSSDNSREVITGILNEKISCIFQSKNEGYAKGNNIGLKYLQQEKRCQYGFVVNPDVFFKEDVIDIICKYFDENEDYAILTCAQIDPSSKKPCWQYATGIYNTFWLHFLSYFNLVRHYYLLKKFNVYTWDPEYSGIIEAAEVPGSFYGIRMNCFYEGAVLDEGTFLYWEERLLGMRVKQMGYKLGYISECHYEHRHTKHSATTNTKSLTLFKYNLQSQRYFQQKYLHFNCLQRDMIRMAEFISTIERWIIMRLTY